MENLTRGRGWSDRVLPQPALEAALDRILMVGGPKRLNQLRDRAREIAPWRDRAPQSADDFLV